MQSRWIALVFAVLSLAAPGPAAAQVTRIRIDGTPGAWPGDLHFDITPDSSAVTFSNIVNPAGTRVSFSQAGVTWRLEFGAPLGMPFEAGTYDGALGYSSASHQPRLLLTYSYSTPFTPYGSFELRQARRDAAGKFTAFWVTFEYRLSPTGPPLRGEIRYRADTALFVRAPKVVSVVAGDPVTFPVAGVDTRGRPVTLSPGTLPAGALLEPGTGGTGTFRWSATPLAEGTYAAEFVATNDEGRTERAVTYVRVVRPLQVTVAGDPTDPVSRGQSSEFGGLESRVSHLVAPSDSSLSFEAYSDYRARILRLNAPNGFALRPGTYAAIGIQGLQAAHEAGVSVVVDGRACSTLQGGVLRVREYRIGADRKLISLWAELEQTCRGASGPLRTEFRYNTSATLDVQAPAVFLAGAREPVAFEVVSLAGPGESITLSAPTLPPGASFTDRGDGTGTFQWTNDLAPGQKTFARFIATTAGGARDTVTTLLASRTAFRVTLSGVPGDPVWTDTPYTFLPSSGTLTLYEIPDTSLYVDVRGQGTRWSFYFAAPLGRRLTTGVYVSDGRDRSYPAPYARLRALRDDAFGPCSDDARFHVRRLARSSSGAITAFWATFEIACAPGAPRQVGEVRFNVDTSLVVTAPGEVRHPANESLRFTLTATESSGRPVAFTPLLAPPGASLSDAGSGSAFVDWPSGPPPGLTRFVVLAAAAGGASDTTTVMVRGAGAAAFRYVSDAGEPIGQGASRTFHQDSTVFDVRDGAGGRVTATIAAATELWSVVFRGPGEKPLLGTGPQEVTSSCVSCAGSADPAALEIRRDDVLCPGASDGRFDVRKLRRAPDGSIRVMWARFEQSCSGPRLWGELLLHTDTLVYVRAAASLRAEAGRPFACGISAVDTRGEPVALAALGLPAGSTFVDHGDGTGTLDWPAGPPATGSFPVTWVATGTGGAADTATTVVEAVRSATFVIQSDVADPVGAGLNVRYGGTDGTVTTGALADSIVAVSFTGAGHSFEYRFQSPWLMALREGMFGRARRAYAAEYDEAGLQVQIDGRLCAMDSAAFHVRRLTRDATGAVTSLWVVFHQRCAGSTAGMSGEVRIAADTSLYIEAPAEVPRDVGEVVTFPVAAIDTRGLPVTLTPAALPPGVGFARAGDSGGEVTYAADDSAGGVVRLTFVAVSADGAVDTVQTFVRTFRHAFLQMVSAPGDYLGLGKTYDLRPRTGAFSVTRSGGAIRVRYQGRLESWDVQLAAPYGRDPAVGRCGGEIPPSGPAPKYVDLAVGTSGRGCSNRATYEIRGIAFDSAGGVRSLWMTFELSCSSPPGTRGEVFFAADTSYWLEGPADQFTDAGVPVSYTVRARGQIAPDVQWTMARAPDGTVMAPGPDASVSIAWPGSLEPGDHPVTLIASGAAGSDSLTTWIHVPKPSYFTIHIPPPYSESPGFDQRFVDRDGVLRAWRNADNSLSARFDGSGHLMSIDFSRADGSRIVPGEYPVSGSIPPAGTSPYGIFFVWDYHYPTPTTGIYRVHEVTYDGAANLVSLWVTWELGLVSASEPVLGEFHLFGPDGPTPVQVASIEAQWVDGANHLRWRIPDATGVTWRVERWQEDRGWAMLREATLDGTGTIALVDADVVRGRRYGYRLAAAAGGPPLGEVWIEVPAPVALGLAPFGPHPASAPLRFAVSMPARGSATLELLDVAGRVVERRRMDQLAEGVTVVTLDGERDLRSGCYFARLTGAGGTVKCSVILLR